ncbi:MAG: ABC transporter permease, partial [Ruthenibacterium sp.]
ILLQGGVWVLISIGAAFPILTGGIDLSIGGTISMCGVIAATLLGMGFPDYIALLVGILVGFLYGAINGFLIYKVKVPPFIATFGTMSIAESLAAVIADSSTLYWKENTKVHFIDLIQTDILTVIFGKKNSMVFSISNYVVVIFLIVVVVYFLYKRTSMEANLYAVGHNPESARLSGINVGRVTIGAYAMSGLMAGIAAVLMITRSNSATCTQGNGMEFTAIVAATIGGCVAEGGKGSLPGAVIGAFTVYIIRNAVNYMGLSTYLAMIITGITLLVGMLI